MRRKLLPWVLAVAAGAALWSGSSQTALAQPSVIATIPIPGSAHGPYGVAVNATTSRVYVTNIHSGNVSVIDTATANVVAVVPVGEEPHAVEVNRSTNRVYVANSGSDSVSVLDGGTNTVVATVPVEAGPHGVAVNAATNRIYVTNHIRGTVSVIDGAANTVLATVPVGELPEGIAVNPVTNRVYAGSPALRNVSVIDGATNAVAATVPLTASPSGLAVNSSTNRVYVTAGSSLVVIDGGTDSVVATVPLGSDGRGVAMDASTNQIYATVAASQVKVVDGETNSVVASVSLDSYANPQNVAVDAAAARVYVAAVNQGTVAVIDGATNALLTTLPVANGPRRVAVNLDTGRVYATNRGADNLSVMDGVSNTVVATVPVEDRPHGVAVNPTTNRVYVANTGSDSVSVIDGDTDTVLATVSVGDGPYGVDVNPTTNRVYVANWASDDVSVISGATNEVVATVAVGDRPHGVAVNPATDQIYVAPLVAPAAWVIDGATNSVVATIPGQGPHTGEVAVNPITNRIYLTSDGFINIYNTVLTVVDGGTNTVLSNGNPCPGGNMAWGVAVNPTINRVYVACHDNSRPSADPDHVAVIDGATETVIGGVDVGNVSDGVAVNPSSGRIYVPNSWDGTLSVIHDSGETAFREFVPAGVAENASSHIRIAPPVYVPAAPTSDGRSACAAGVVRNQGSTAEVSATGHASSNAVDAAQGPHDCILGPKEYDQCVDASGVVVDDPTCPEWSRSLNSQCMAYGVYVCYPEGSYCWLIDWYAVPTDQCASGYACPQEYSAYWTDTSCSDAGGIVETPLNNGCLHGNTCTFYETVSLACEAPPAVGGIAELPDVAGASAEQTGAAPEGSGWSVGAYAVLAGGLAAAVVAISAVAWYGRRRWQR